MEGRRTNSSWTKRFAEGIQELLRTPVRFAFHLAVARLITQWRSLLTIVAGTVLAASIGALVPLYTTAVSQVGMTQRLDEEDARDVHVQANISLRASNWTADPVAEDTADAAPATIDNGLQTIASASTVLVLDHVDDDLGVIEDWVGDVVSYLETEAMGLSQVAPDGEEPVPLTGVRARLAYYEDWTDYVRVVAGRLPDTAAPEDVDIEIVVGLNVANELNLETDMVIGFDQGMDARGNVGRGHPSSQPFTARIVGVISPLDDEAAYWMEPSPLRLIDPGLWDHEFVFLTTEDATFRVTTGFVPDTPTRIGWRVLFAHDNLPFSRIDEARAALSVFANNMDDTFTITDQEDVSLTTGRQDFGFNYHTRLIDYDIIRREKDKGILLDYAKEQELLAAPFGLLLLQVGALVLFYLMVTAALVRRGERREIAMLQSRGAWDSQILLFRGIEAFMICALAVLIAPFLSRILLTALGPSVANTDDFPLPLTANVFLFAGFASTVTFFALMGTLTPVLKLPLVLAGGAASRSDKQLWWQKYYIDAILALVGVGALWLLVRTGSPLSDVNLGGKQADPLMLMAPALLFLALGSLALRFFPILAGLASRAAASGRGLLSAWATWQLSREPIHYGRITFLLALAIGIGWFATSFRATVTNSHDDQAKYRVGTDMRLVERDTSLNTNRARTVEYYEGLTDVAQASSTYRVINANLSTSLTGDLRGTILGINPETFGETLYWRSDLGSIYTPRHPSDPPLLPTPGHTLPDVPAQIGMWARFEVSRFFGGDDQLFQQSVGRLVQRTELSVRLQDANGAWVVVPVEPVEIEYQRIGADGPGFDTRAFTTTGWVYMVADIAAMEYEPVGPLNLVSFYWTYRGFNANGERGLRLTLADMTLFGADGTATPHTFFAGSPWEFAYDRGATATERATPGWDMPGERADSVYIRWDQDAQRTTVGILTNYPDMGPIDAVVSSRMQEENGLTWGLDAAPFTLLGIGRTNPQFRAVQVTHYYPSLYNNEPNEANIKGNSFMVVDVRELLYRLNRRPSATYYADEVWLRMDESFNVRNEDDVDAFIESLGDGEASQVVFLDEVTLAKELSKLRTDPLALGLLGLMYLAFIMALTLSVVGLITYAGLTAQSRRSEFGVLRALGLSSLRVVGGLALEQTFVMIIGVILGAG
ncbi:MAG: ABC transporter permease, partial [Anaerolineae bacterium]|nr:ABC transporter permease [Anaerolineae bacterium]